MSLLREKRICSYSCVYAHLSAGVVCISKAVISEVSDDSNQAIGITLVGTAFGSGYIIGPAVAGAIADPVGQYNLTITSELNHTEMHTYHARTRTHLGAHTLFFAHLFVDPFLRSFLSKFPFSLPPIFGALIFTVSTILTILFLPETLGMKK